MTYPSILCHPDDLTEVGISLRTCYVVIRMRYASNLKSSGWDSKFRFSTPRGGPPALPYDSHILFRCDVYLFDDPVFNEWLHWQFYSTTRVTHACVNKLGHHCFRFKHIQWQTVIWSNACVSSIGPLRTKIEEIWTKINKLSFKKMHSKMWFWQVKHVVSASMHQTNLGGQCNQCSTITVLGIHDYTSDTSQILWNLII